MSIKERREKLEEQREEIAKFILPKGTNLKEWDKEQASKEPHAVLAQAFIPWLSGEYQTISVTELMRRVIDELKKLEEK